MSSNLLSTGEHPPGPLSDRLMQLSRAIEAARGVRAVDTAIELNLPCPPSVNKLRRYNFANRPVHKRWIRLCNGYVLASALMRTTKPIKGRFIAEITFDENVTAIDDLDNGIKALIDYARTLGLIVNDDRRYMRELHVKWGDVPIGCRLTLHPLQESGQ